MAMKWNRQIEERVFEQLCMMCSEGGVWRACTAKMVARPLGLNSYLVLQGLDSIVISGAAEYIDNKADGFRWFYPIVSLSEFLGPDNL